MQETMMPTYVVCWWSLRQDGNSVERWNRMELRMMVALYACWRAGHLSALAVRQAKNLELTESRIEKELWICEAVIPSSSVLQTGWSSVVRAWGPCRRSLHSYKYPPKRNPFLHHLHRAGTDSVKAV